MKTFLLLMAIGLFVYSCDQTIHDSRDSIETEISDQPKFPMDEFAEKFKKHWADFEIRTGDIITNWTTWEDSLDYFLDEMDENMLADTTIKGYTFVIEAKVLASDTTVTFKEFEEHTTPVNVAKCPEGYEDGGLCGSKECVKETVRELMAEAITGEDGDCFKIRVKRGVGKVRICYQDCSDE